ncbi:MAG: hypothetical protein ABIJ84_04655 [bacterium]
MPIDEKLINRKITLINIELKRLKALSKLSLRTYLSQTDYEILAERYLERIINRMIDINYLELRNALRTILFWFSAEPKQKF